MNPIDLRITNKTGTFSNSYEVVDTLRFIAIASVLWGHSCIMLDGHLLSSLPARLIQSVALELGKAGTVFFFMIGGFLLESKINTYSISAFFKSRIKSTILPWIAIIFSFCMLQVFCEPGSKMLLLHNGLMKLLSMVFSLLKLLIFHYSFWFVPVFLISVSVVIFLKKWVYRHWLFFVFLGITVLYNLNLYYNWFNVSHTTAFLGYVSVLLIGVHARKNIDHLTSLCNRLSWRLLLALYLITFAVACAEGYLLSLHKSIDPYASLRISNILNAVVASVALLKFGPIYRINKLRPRNTVYGIFLIHNIAGWLLVFAGHKLLSSLNASNVLLVVFISLILFALNFCLSYLFVSKFLSLKKSMQLNPFLKMLYLQRGVVS